MNLQEIFCNIMYLKASADIKISTFLEQNGVWGGSGCGSQNGPLITISKKSSFYDTILLVLVVLKRFTIFACTFMIKKIISPLHFLINLDEQDSYLFSQIYLKQGTVNYAVNGKQSLSKPKCLDTKA